MPKLLKDHHSSKGTALEMAYQFDAARGLLKNRTNKLFNLQESFGFDELNRLIKQNQNGSKDLFSYDNRGRITGSTDMGKYSYFPDNYHLKQIEHNDEGNAHRELFGDLQLTYNSHKKPTEIVGKLGTYQFGYNPLQTRAVMRFFATGSIEPNLTKIYSADNAVEVEIRNGQTRILTFVDGGPYEASVIHTKTFGGAGSDGYLYLHKDYLGSILAISDAQANILEQRSFDAWGSLTHLKTKNGLFTTEQAILNEILQNGLILDRGYTGHEHLWMVGIVNMNGRLYDPALKRFLSPDNFIQDPYNTQNFNRYGYVLNNPLIYTDPSGEAFWAVVGFFVKAALIGAGISIATTMIANAIAGNPLHWGIGKSAAIGGLSALVTAGLAAGVNSILTSTNSALFSSSAAGLSSTMMSALRHVSKITQTINTVAGATTTLSSILIGNLVSNSVSSSFAGSTSSGLNNFNQSFNSTNQFNQNQNSNNSNCCEDVDWDKLITEIDNAYMSVAAADGPAPFGDVVGITAMVGVRFGKGGAMLIKWMQNSRTGVWMKEFFKVKQITVLGKYPDYINLANKIKSNRFNIPIEIWNKMTPAEQWNANVKFLDRAIKRGDEFLLSNPVKNINDVTGYFRQELDYLIKIKGYKLNSNGTKLVR